MIVQENSVKTVIYKSSNQSTEDLICTICHRLKDSLKVLKERFKQALKKKKKTFKVLVIKFIQIDDIIKVSSISTLIFLKVKETT